MFEFAYPDFVRRFVLSMVLGGSLVCAAAGGLAWYWSRCNFLDYVNRASASPRQPGERYLFACSRTWRTTDGGQHWESLKTHGLPFGAREGFIAVARKPGLLYLGLIVNTPVSFPCWSCGQARVSPAMFASTDSGRTWRLVYTFEPGLAGAVSFVGVYADPEREVEAWAILVHNDQVIFYNSTDGRNWRIKCSDRQPDVSASRCDMPERIFTFEISNE